jgi:hypothetical protein
MYSRKFGVRLRGKVDEQRNFEMSESDLRMDPRKDARLKTSAYH